MKHIIYLTLIAFLATSTLSSSGAEARSARKKSKARATKTHKRARSPKVTQNVDSQKLQNSFDSLGGNEALVEKSQKFDPENEGRIVQKRSVDRHNRVEVGFQYGFVGGGDAYLNTENVGGSLDYHFTPRWSLGVRYAKSYNSLTREGQVAYEEAQNQKGLGNVGTIVDIDYPISTTMAMVNFYPIYGKMNLLDLGISQFDLYLLAGYGKVELSSGMKDTITGGLGAGIWWNQWLTTRIEGRYQTYQDQVYTGNRQLHLAIFSAHLGIML